ncbi:MAG: DUF3189 family protein [Firmicutes bacterium]|nr:DUF3189 family protein [Bacillota bacterium]
MKVIYHCYGGTHSSVLAAAIHLGLLEGKNNLSAQELFSCPLFDCLDHSQIGTINSMGKDSKGHEIYVMGCKNAGSLVEKIIPEFCRIVGINQDDILLVCTIPCLNIFLRIGGYLSRRVKLVALGRFFLLLGARLSMNSIRLIVREAKQKLQEKENTKNRGILTDSKKI